MKKFTVGVEKSLKNRLNFGWQTDYFWFYLSKMNDLVHDYFGLWVQSFKIDVFATSNLRKLWTVTFKTGFWYVGLTQTRVIVYTFKHRRTNLWILEFSFQSKIGRFNPFFRGRRWKNNSEISDWINIRWKQSILNKHTEYWISS